MNPVIPLINVPIMEKAVEQDFAMEPTRRPFQGVSERRFKTVTASRAAKRANLENACPSPGTQAGFPNNRAHNGRAAKQTKTHTAELPVSFLPPPTTARHIAKASQSTDKRAPATTDIPRPPWKRMNGDQLWAMADKTGAAISQ